MAAPNGPASSPMVYPVYLPGAFPQQTGDDQAQGPGIYAIQQNQLAAAMGMGCYAPTTLVPLTYKIPTESVGAPAGEENAQDARQQNGPQRQVVVRRFHFAFQLDLALIIKLAAVVFLFSQEGSKQRLFLLILSASLIYLYQTGAITPFVRWLQRAGGAAARPPQAPARVENRVPQPAQNDGNEQPNAPANPDQATKEVVSQRSMSRGSVDERWQHRTNVQGISSISQVSMPVMHKAERKYEIGKVSDEEGSKQRQLKAILNKLTPQNFEKVFAQVKELNIDNVVTLTGVISQIFDKALMEPTFCEMYASFCSRLAGDLPNFVKDDEKITFKRLLLNKCQEEFERGEREGGAKQSEGEREEKRIRARRRMLGNIRLIGELYKKKMLTERIMHECINKLLGEYQNPDEEDLEALCILMSTIGEMIDHLRAKVHMDFYFDLIQKLSENVKLSSRIRFMLEDVIDLRKNKWRQRRKVEGPKKIEEVRRDAVKQKFGQSTRFGSSPNYNNSSVTGISSGLRPGPPDSTRGSSALASRGSSQVRTYGSQNVNLDARYQSSNRVLPVPLHQRRADKSIRFGPQGDLGREMSLCGKSQVSNDILPEVPLSSHHGQASENSRDGSFTGMTSNPTSFKTSNTSWGMVDVSSAVLSTVGQMHTSCRVRKDICVEAQTFPEEVLQEKSILTIKEFYSAKDEKEVALCMKELNAPSFYPSLVSLWIIDSFERKDLERELLAKLLVYLCTAQEHLLSQRQLLQGFQHVLSTLEDAVTDAPKATKFLGQIFAKVILEDVISLTEVGGLLQERDGGKEEPAGHHAPDDSLASEVLGSMLESIRVERGDNAVDEIRAKSNLQCSRRPGVCV